MFLLDSFFNPDFLCLCHLFIISSGSDLCIYIIHVEDIYFADVSFPQVFALLEYGNTKRRVSPTQANKESSRSHAVLQASGLEKM